MGLSGPLIYVALTTEGALDSTGASGRGMRLRDDDEAVLGVFEGGDQEAADETEDENVALHDGVVKKYIPDNPVLRSRLKAFTNRYSMKEPAQIQAL